MLSLISANTSERAFQLFARGRSIREEEDICAGRRAKELLNAGNFGLDDVRRVLVDLKNDFTHLAIATANATACRHRDSLASLLETL